MKLKIWEGNPLWMILEVKPGYGFTIADATPGGHKIPRIFLLAEQYWSALVDPEEWQ